jgi:PAP2 superfamily
MRLIQSAAIVAAIAAYAAPPAAFSQSSNNTLQPRSAGEINDLLQTQDEAATIQSFGEDKTPALIGDRTAPRIPASTLDRFLMWTEIALDTNALDYVPFLDDPTKPGKKKPPGEQFGPHKSSRAIAMVQIAMFEAVNARTQKYQSYTKLKPEAADVSIDAAIAQAAHDALVALYKMQKERLDAIFADDSGKIPGGPSMTGKIDAGFKLGARAAASIVKLRANDKSNLPEPEVGKDYTVHHRVGEWDIDPVSNLKVALGGRWSEVTPFALKMARQFRAGTPPKPDFSDAGYKKDFIDVHDLGGDPDSPDKTPTNRNDDQTFIGKFFSYDGTPGLCAPPRLYNQISIKIARDKNLTDLADFSRYLALINLAMADAGISAWEAKYHYKYWRPVTGIRYKKPGTDADSKWHPLGAQETNTRSRNITPPFPAYPSGHATFGGALFEVLRQVWGDTGFTVVSDEFNGKNKDYYGNIRPLKPMTFASLTDAEAQNARSRIYLGVHWQFDGVAGIKQGNSVGLNAFCKTFRPVGEKTPPAVCKGM